VRLVALLPPPELARDITIPEPGSTTAREVLSRSLGRLGLGDLRSAPHHPPPLCQEEAAVLLRFSRAAARSKKFLGAQYDALRRPTLSGLVRSLRHAGPPDRPQVYREMTAQLAFELAIAGVLDGPVSLRHVPARLLSIPERLSLTMAPGATALAFENGSATVERGGTSTRVDLAAPSSAPGIEVERPYHPISGDIVLALTDNNPLALVEAHPDKSGNAVDLGGRPVGEWVAALSTALARIERHLPEIRGEMDLFVSQIVPVGWDPERHLSASYQETIGTIYLSLHPSSMTLSEALVHELSHNKLNALFEIDDVLDNAWEPLYASPVRPDPRPLHGVLLAVHAFLPVARLYERMIASGDAEAVGAQHDAFRARFADVRRINAEGAELLLREGRPTPLGRELFAEIRRWHEHYQRFEGIS
jgi:HEXXH motif-containing protein